jgi:hypothetical protein
MILPMILPMIFTYDYVVELGFYVKGTGGNLVSCGMMWGDTGHPMVSFSCIHSTHRARLRGALRGVRWFIR